MIRELELSELGKLENGATEFYALAELPGKFDFSILKKNWEYFYGQGIGAIFALVDEKTDEIYGALGCVKVPDLITNILIATEMFWFVMDGRRGEGMKLLYEFESWAKANGCKSMRMMYLSNVMSEDVKAVYKRRGYREVETAYEKEIN